MYAAPEPLLKPEEVMARLGYDDRDAFMRMVRQKGLPRVRINRKVIRFERAVIERWIQKRSTLS